LSIVTTATRRPSTSAARAASLAIVVVLPTPVGPTSMTARAVELATRPRLPVRGPGVSAGPAAATPLRSCSTARRSAVSSSRSSAEPVPRSSARARTRARSDRSSARSGATTRSTSPSSRVGRAAQAGRGAGVGVGSAGASSPLSIAAAIS
jgi:hypothetical protein